MEDIPLVNTPVQASTANASLNRKSSVVLSHQQPKISEDYSSSDLEGNLSGANDADSRVKKQKSKKTSLSSSFSSRKRRKFCCSKSGVGYYEPIADEDTDSEQFETNNQFENARNVLEESCLSSSCHFFK